jgi:4-hydroxybenzoate polyprenyltransferase
MRSDAPSPGHTVAALVREIRPHQWVKNILVFAPLVLAHSAGDPHRLWRALAAFASFSLAASANYVTNDLLDIGADRLHPIKRKRPLASGDLPVFVAVVAAIVCLAAAFGLAVPLGSLFAIEIATYLVLAFLYSTWFKKKEFIDVLLLAGFYSIRIVAGGTATGVEVSAWLLAFSMFLFLDLALLKRYADLELLHARGDGAAAGRGYLVEDRHLIRTMGVAAGYVSVLVLALYITGDHATTLYRHPKLLWLTCPLLLYWVSRMWFLAQRGRIDNDPIVSAAKDPASYAVGLLVSLIFLFAV